MNEFDDPLADTQPRAGVARRLEAHYAALGPTADEVARIQAQIAQRLDAGAGDARSLPRLAPRTRGTHTRALGLAWAAAVTATLGVGLAVAALGGLSGASWFGKVRAMLPLQPVAPRVGYVPFVGFRDLSRPEQFGVPKLPIELDMPDGTRARLVQAWHEADRLIVAIALDTAAGQPLDVMDEVTVRHGSLRWTNENGKVEARTDGVTTHKEEGDPPVPHWQDPEREPPPDNLVHLMFTDVPRRLDAATLHFTLSTHRGGVKQTIHPDGRSEFEHSMEVSFPLAFDRLDALRAEQDYPSPRTLPPLTDQRQGIIVQLLDVTDSPLRTVVRVLVTYDPAAVETGEQPAGMREVAWGATDGTPYTLTMGAYLGDAVGQSLWAPTFNRGLQENWYPAAWLNDLTTGRDFAAHDEPPCTFPAQTVWMRRAKFMSSDGLRLPRLTTHDPPFDDDVVWSIRRHDGAYPLIGGTIINYCFDPVPRGGKRRIVIPSLDGWAGIGPARFTHRWQMSWTDQAVR
ncbi:MAG: hypothetical protein IPG72_14590 [Ardenticatenales bacterium]|nr:hypothetical protein [Ardenticatenales bacterium]